MQVYAKELARQGQEGGGVAIKAAPWTPSVSSRSG